MFSSGQTAADRRWGEGVGGEGVGVREGGTSGPHDLRSVVRVSVCVWVEEGGGGGVFRERGGWKERRRNE